MKNPFASNMKLNSSIESFVNDRLIDSDLYLSPQTVFPCATLLYETPIINSFVQTVIDGSSRPAPFLKHSGSSPYGELMSSVKALSGNETSYAFYGRDPDNALSVLSWVRPCPYEQACCILDSFEIAPAEEGGSSWLGFIGKSTEWLLLHELDPGESFKITAYGTPQFCRKLASSLGITYDAG